VQAYAENVFDEFTWDGYNANGGILPSHFFGPMRPLTIGVRAGMSWD
jgi:iron complex outermembrane receptor protein